MSSVFPDAQLDVDLLICEVQKRPCLYDKNDLHYGDPQYKRDEWEEISSILYKDVWNTYDDEEQVAKCDLVIKRWKNLRACFSRECKRQKDPKWIYGVAYKRRKYIYYNELSFLKSEYDTEETTRDIDLSENPETENITLTVNNKFGEPITDSILVPKNNAKGKIKKKMNRIESPSNFETTNSVNTTPLTNSVKDKSSTNSDHLVTTNIKSNTDNASIKSVTKPSSNSVLINVNDTDSTSFALSLVPMLNMLSVDDKVECQIKILSAILPFMKKCRDDTRTRDGGKRKTAMPKQTYGKKRMEDIVTVEIKSEGESDGDL